MMKENLFSDVSVKLQEKIISTHIDFKYNGFDYALKIQKTPEGKWEAVSLYHEKLRKHKGICPFCGMKMDDEFAHAFCLSSRTQVELDAILQALLQHPSIRMKFLFFV